MGTKSTTIVILGEDEIWADSDTLTSHTQAKRRFVETVQSTTTHISSGGATGVVEMAVRVVVPVVMAEMVEAFCAIQPLVGKERALRERGRL